MSRRWEDLLEQVARERYQRLVAHATLVSASPSDAQDLVQEALIAAFSGRARFGSVEQAEAYVRRAIASRAIDSGRRKTREARLLARAAAQTPVVVHDDDRLPGADVVRALGTLSPRERACVVLRQMEDLSVTETASVLGLSEGAVKRYTSDGLARLNAQLGSTADATERIPVTQLTPTEVRRDR
ncbi:RNA polymerase sigma factor [Cellulomonas sp. Root137]|uniref:RNA polymerase sigma factor n=1 Tax=Cellulomonas sp. Root137 TaxID=1736459 RepID=UPI0006FC0B59|nr:sigma-70 family RNA polymerase sigma factor [Cellulomonas sp. Root137]KQY41926.1 RNA polymerase subunit sigma-24 [Cellulomonas sp. Root137]